MMKQLTRLAPLGLMVALAVSISGCSAGQQVTASDIIQKMRDTAKTTQSVQSSVDLSLTLNKDGLKSLVQGLGMMPGSGSSGSGMMGGKQMGDWTAMLPDSVSVSINSWKQAPDKARIEITGSTIPGAKGDILVYDGQKAYAYDAAHNTVYTLTPSKALQSSNMPAEVQNMLNSIQGTDFQAQVDKVIAAADIKLVGTEKVAGIDAYHLDITPKPDFADKLGIPQAQQLEAGVLVKDAKVSLWVDRDRWVPLKLTLEHPNMGTFTYTANSLDLNKSIDPSTFVLQVPAGAKTVDLDQAIQNMQPKSTTLPAARDAAAKEGWTLLEPTYLPAGSTLVGVQQMGGNGANLGMMKGMMGSGSGMSGFVLKYSSSSADFSIMESNRSNPMMGQAGAGMMGGQGALKDVTVRGVQGKTYTTDDGKYTVVFWKENGSNVWVAIAGNLSQAETLKVAEGLK